MVVLAARHNMGARRLEETNRLIVYALDNAAAMADDATQNPLGKFLCLFDLSGAPPCTPSFMKVWTCCVHCKNHVRSVMQTLTPTWPTPLWTLRQRLGPAPGYSCCSHALSCLAAEKLRCFLLQGCA